MVLTKMIKLLQVCSGFIKADTGEELVFRKPSKLILLKEIIEEIGDKKIIIWNQFRCNVDMIATLCRYLKIGYVTYDGRISHNIRAMCVKRFQENKDCRVFIGQVQTGGLGINLTAASYVIYYTNTYSLAMRLQSEDRAHRIGQKNKVTYIDLIAKKSIDESLIKVLRKKKNFSYKLIDNIEDII